jgi:hypothetical protein
MASVDDVLFSGSPSGFWIRFVLSVLATWRVSHLLASEDGPWDVVVRLRRRLGASMLGRMMDCFGCTSLWVALPLSLFVVRDPLAVFVCWLALSGAAMLLERMNPPPLVIEQTADTIEKE